MADLVEKGIRRDQLVNEISSIVAKVMDEEGVKPPLTVRAWIRMNQLIGDALALNELQSD